MLGMLRIVLSLPFQKLLSSELRLTQIILAV